MATEIPEVTEMTVEPSPQWIKDAGEEIAKRFHLEFLDKICVRGIISKHYRLKDEGNGSDNL